MMRAEKVLLLGLAACLAAACGDARDAPVATVPPATLEARVEYARNITDRADRKRDADLYEYFCQNTFDTPCPSDILDQLAPYQVSGGISRVHLADAFVRLRVARDEGDIDVFVADESYIAAAYQVILGRAADEGGAAAHLSFIRSGGQLQATVQAMLQSAEFRTK